MKLRRFKDNFWRFGNKDHKAQSSRPVNFTRYCRNSDNNLLYCFREITLVQEIVQGEDVCSRSSRSHFCPPFIYKTHTPLSSVAGQLALGQCPPGQVPPAQLAFGQCPPEQVPSGQPPLMTNIPETSPPPHQKLGIFLEKIVRGSCPDTAHTTPLKMNPWFLFRKEKRIHIA